jgi:hypothetical protein
VGTYDDCLDRCGNTFYATIQPSAGGGMGCRCSNKPPVVVPSGVTCDATRQYVYYQVPPTPSNGGLRRRAPRATSRAERFCPRGREPCRVAEGSSEYECLQISSELSE